MKDGRALIRKGPLNCQNPRTLSPAASVTKENQLHHILEKIPLPENYSRKSYFLRCRECSKTGKRGQTSWRCRGCEGFPPLCQGKCFENFHNWVSCFSSFLIFLGTFLKFLKKMYFILVQVSSQNFFPQCSFIINKLFTK